ncbi:MAG TPA: tyrosine-type recombinase/integrase [Gemmataceae bacterium]|jgi:hypothetical protein
MLRKKRHGSIPILQKPHPGLWSITTASDNACCCLLQGYFAQLPDALQEVGGHSKTPRKQCVFTPHSTRATTATLLLEDGEDIRKVQDLLGYRHVTTTQISDKRHRLTSEGASYRVPIGRWR